MIRKMLYSIIGLAAVVVLLGLPLVYFYLGLNP